MKIIVIDNLNYGYHFEIIESLIIKYNILCSIPKNNTDKIYLENIVCSSFKNYIENKYSNVSINKKIENYDIKIFSTFYSFKKKNFEQQLNKPNKYFFISHDIEKSLKMYKNVYFLSPLCKTDNYIYADILPQNNRINTNIPIYVVQGNFSTNRRNYNLLYTILKMKLPYDYKIKFIGRGTLPAFLKPFNDRIIVKNSLNFIDYHKELSDCYGILPLISKDTHPQYYSHKLTSTINYARGYNLKCIIDKDLQNIYQLQNVEIYNNKNNIWRAFRNTLKDFYEKNKN